MGAAASVPEGTLEADTVETALVKGVESALSQAINRSVAARPEWRQAPPAVSEMLQLIAKDVSVTAEKQAAAEWLAAWPGGDLDAKDEEGWSALQRAAEAGQAAAVAELLRRPSVEVNGVEPTNGQPALVLASRGGHAAVVRVVLACAEVGVHHKVRGDYTALHIAAECDNEAVVRLLLAHTAVDPNQAKQNGVTPLFFTAAKGHEAVVRLLLAHAAIDPNQAKQNGVTPLFMAAQLGQAAVVRLLLAHAAVDANQAKQDGITPLYMAAVNGHGAVVRLLLAHAAIDPNQTDQIGRTPLWMAAQSNQEAVVRLLLAHPAVDAERADQWGRTPLLAACDTRSTAAALALLDAKADPNARNNDGDSPLVVARRGDNAQLLAALVAAGADVTALYAPLVAKCMLGDAHAARRLLLEAPAPEPPGAARDGEKGGLPLLVLAGVCLCGSGHELTVTAIDCLGSCDVCTTPVSKGEYIGLCLPCQWWACCKCSAPAAAAKAEQAEQAEKAEKAEAEQAGISVKELRDKYALAAPLVAACLRGDATALAALDGSDACEARADGLPPAFCFAVELGDAAVVAAALAGAKGLGEPQRAVLCAQAALAAGTHDAAASDYVPGARYHATLLALAGEGLIDVAKCAAAKTLFLGYLGSVAASAHLAAAPRAFGELKAAMEARLEVIAAPLELLYKEERLGARLGALGEATLGAKVALDDDGLLPMPKYILGAPPSNTVYETYLLRLIVMASLALDNLFVRKLRSALEALGDPTKTVVADREVRIYGSDGALLLTITRAPVKSRARMLNKLESAEDHRNKEVPRPKANVDTVRAGIIVEDAGVMAAVLEAVGAHVGRFLRSKNAFREDAEVSYGYRAFLGNLQLESGLTVGDVFGGEQRAKWQALAQAGAAADGKEPGEVKAVLDALLATKGDQFDEDNADVADLPLNIAAEVQLIYKPYLERGRMLSHLPYKVVRCAAPSELARDAGGKRAVDEAQREAARACGEIVEGLLATRS